MNDKEWLKEYWAEKRRALHRRNIQDAIARGEYPPVNWMAVISGSNLDWASSGSPLVLLKDGSLGIPEMDTMVRCWFCGWPSPIDKPRCGRCGAPLLEE